MIALAWILLASASAAVQVRELVDQVYQIPANDWRYVELGLKQKSPAVEAQYHVEDGSREVRLVLVAREDLERLRRREHHDMLTVTPTDASGRLLYDIHRSGEYAIVVENRGDSPANVRLHVWLDFSGRQRVQVTQLSPGRQLAVVMISCAVFFAIVTYSARRLLRAIRR